MTIRKQCAAKAAVEQGQEERYENLSVGTVLCLRCWLFPDLLAQIRKSSCSVNPAFQRLILRPSRFRAAERSPNAQFTGAADLKAQLSSAQVLVLPYGSAFPEDDWQRFKDSFSGAAISSYSGTPIQPRSISRRARLGSCAIYSVRYTRPLMMINIRTRPVLMD